MANIKKAFGWIPLLESNISFAEQIYRLLGLAYIFGGSGVTAWLSQQSPLLAALGPFAWVIIFFITAFLLTGLMWIYQTANLKASIARMNDFAVSKTGNINPLEEAFSNEIINIDDLRLPGKMIHTNKRFSRCEFVGPGAIALMGGHHENVGYYECGTVIAVPPDTGGIAGIVGFDNCTFIDCKFYRITIITDQVTGRAMSGIEGMEIVGLSDG